MASGATSWSVTSAPMKYDAEKPPAEPSEPKPPLRLAPPVPAGPPAPVVPPRLAVPPVLAAPPVPATPPAHGLTTRVFGPTGAGGAPNRTAGTNRGRAAGVGGATVRCRSPRALGTARAGHTAGCGRSAVARHSACPRRSAAAPFEPPLEPPPVREQADKGRNKCDGRKGRNPGTGTGWKPISCLLAGREPAAFNSCARITQMHTA